MKTSILYLLLRNDLITASSGNGQNKHVLRASKEAESLFYGLLLLIF